MSSLLVVDDSLVDRRMVGGLLEAGGHTAVEFAVNGREAIESMRRSRPQLVITDLVMPEFDGLQLVNAVVREFPGVPVVLMTGYGSEEIAVRALRAGAASYVPKRALPQLLLETVSKILSISSEAENCQRLFALLSHSDCEFSMGNDLALVPQLVGYLRTCMSHMGLTDEVVGIRVSVALEEALLNAIFHGNLELSSEIRELDRDEYHGVVERRRRSLPYRDRKVTVQAKFSRQRAVFVIRDDGPGFEPDRLPDPTDSANLECASGRGVLLMRTFMDNVAFNETGNEVTMSKQLCGCPEPVSSY